VLIAWYRHLAPAVVLLLTACTGTEVELAPSDTASNDAGVGVDARDAGSPLDGSPGAPPSHADAMPMADAHVARDAEAQAPDAQPDALDARIEDATQQPPVVPQLPAPVLLEPRDAGTGDAAAEAQALCPDGFARGAFQPNSRLVHALNPGPEGVGVCPDGTVLASAGEVLWRASLDGGAPTSFASLPGRSLEMIQCDAAGRIFVADISPMFDMLALRPRRFDPAVMMLAPDAGAAVALKAPADERADLTGFNGLLAIPKLGLYASDMLAGVIVRYRERAPGVFEASVVARELLGANGIAYDAKRSLLYVAVTGMVLTRDRVVAFHVGSDGTLGRVQEVWSSAELHGTDGLAIDEQGVLYRADQLHGAVVRMSDDRVIARVPNPASLAFRGGTLYISDFKMLGALQNGGEGGVYAVELGVCAGALSR
jgi:sugar lactone lactonase YvrE